MSVPEGSIFHNCFWYNRVSNNNINSLNVVNTNPIIDMPVAGNVGNIISGNQTSQAPTSPAFSITAAIAGSYVSGNVIKSGAGFSFTGSDGGTVNINNIEIP